MKRFKRIPKVQPKDLWLVFILLIIAAATVPSLPGESGSRLMTAFTHVTHGLASLR